MISSSNWPSLVKTGKEVQGRHIFIEPGDRGSSATSGGLFFSLGFAWGYFLLDLVSLEGIRMEREVVPTLSPRLNLV